MPASNPNRAGALPKPKAVKAKPKVARRVAPSPPARSDIQSSGGNYGIPKATKYAKKVAKEAPRGDIGSSGGDYGKGKALAYLKHSQQATVGLHLKRGAKASGPKLKLNLPDLSALPGPEQQKAVNAAARATHVKLAGTETAPALKALNYVGRPGRAVESSIDAALRGKSIPHAISDAVLHGKGATGSNVLEDLGVHNKILKAIGGTGLDIVTDPATYTTFGLAAPAKAIAEKEAARIAEKALKHGMTEDLAQRLGRRAGARAAAKAGANRGVQAGARARIPFTNAGFHLKTSGRATSAVARKTVHPLAKRASESGVVQTLGKGVVHDFRPTGVSAAQHTAIRAALAQHRAATNAAELSAQRLAKATAKTVKTPQGAKHIIDLVESGRAHEHPVAAAIAQDLGRNTRELHSRGLLKEGPFRPQGPVDARQYFPHLRRQDLEAVDKATPKAVKAGTTVVQAGKGRKIRKSLKVIRGDSTQPFSEDLATVMGAHMTKSGRAKALSDLWQKVAATGKEIKPGKDLHVNDLGNELVYKVTPHGLQPLVKEGGDQIDLAAIKKVLDGKAGGRHVVLSRDVVEGVKGRLAHAAQGDRGPFRYIDTLTGKWKTATTVLNPSYHGRNLIGDTSNAILGGTRLRDFRQSGKALHALELRNRVQASPERFAPGSLTAKATKLGAAPVKLGKSGTTTIDNLVKEAEGAGAIRTGFIGGEVTQLAGGKGKAGFILRKFGKTSRPALIRTANEYREDYPRLATYITARKKGMTPEQASQHVATHHFDYQDLTPFERQSLRRIFPFYTFFARNTRLQVTKLLSEPGKFAAMSHVLDEAAKAAGFADYQDYAGKLPDSQQRGIPFPFKVGGKVYNAYAGLPTTDLNQATASPGDWAKNLANRVSFLKVIPEIYLNFSVFFQSQIQNPKAPTVAAPSFVGELPDFMKKRLGVTKFLDKQTGKMIWGWNAKADYIARQLPQTNLGVGLATPTAGSRGMTPVLAALSQSGIRVAPAQLQKQQINTAYSKLTKIQDQMGALNQRGINAHNPTLEYRRLQIEARIYTREIQQMQLAQGNKIIGGKRVRRAVKQPAATVAPPAAAPTGAVAPPPAPSGP